MPLRLLAMAAAILVLAGARLSAQPRPTIDAHAASGSAAHRRGHRRNRMGRADRRRRLALLQPAARRPGPAAHDRLVSYDTDTSTSPSMRRSGSERHQDIDHAARQHLAGRLDRSEPRRARHGTAVVPHDGEPERRAARRVEQRGGQRGRGARLDLGQRGPPDRRRAT